jgi:uncharacterized membrane protein
MKGTATAGQILRSRGELPARRRPERENVGGAERVVSALVGGALTLHGLRRGGLGGLLVGLVGGVVAKRGLTGHCPAYAALGVNTAESAR